MNTYRSLVLAAFVGSTVLFGCNGGSGESSDSAATSTVPPDGAATAVPGAGGGEYLGDYDMNDASTSVDVTVAAGVRTIRTNAVPNHTIGKFPNPEDPYAVAPQDFTWQLPTVAEPSDSPQPVSISGIAINGVTIGPDLVAGVDCATGESYEIEEIGGTYNLGLDMNNASVDPDGQYVYHGVPRLLIEPNKSQPQDLVLVGFAPDGYLIYFSKSGEYRSSYKLSDTPRTGAGCRTRIGNKNVDDLVGTLPDGSFTSDWVWDEAAGDLDRCNGTVIDGQYAYLVTDGYPFVSRCLIGEFNAATFGRPEAPDAVVLPNSVPLPTVPPTAPPTVPPTVAPTAPPTVPPTAPPTVAPTVPATLAPTEATPPPSPD